MSPSALHLLRFLLSTATIAASRMLFVIFMENLVVICPFPRGLFSLDLLLGKKFYAQHDDLVREVSLTNTNPCFARNEFVNGKEANVSLSDSTPRPPRPHD